MVDVWRGSSSVSSSSSKCCALSWSTFGLSSSSSSCSELASSLGSDSEWHPSPCLDSSSGSNSESCILTSLDGSAGCLTLSYGFIDILWARFNLADHLHLWGSMFEQVVLFLFEIGLCWLISKIAGFWITGFWLISRGAMRPSKVKFCWTRSWLTISLINPWWLTMVLGCLACLILLTVSCNNEFKKDGKLIVSFSFKTTKSLSCRGLTTSRHLSQVM